MSAYRYKAFISYSHADIKWARWLQRSLETYALPKRIQREYDCPAKVGSVFRDADELGVASDLSETIREALSSSECLIVICSPEAGRSDWVNREVQAFQQLQLGQIFTVIVSGDTEDEQCLPFLLRDQEEHAPLLVDPRPAADGKRVALARIVAGVLQIDFSRLQDRDARRRHARMTALVGFAFLAVVLTSVLALVAIDARNEAIAERERTEQQTLIAEQSVRFLTDVFRVSDPSEARGNTITARELLDRASKRIADELANDPTARITLMKTMASVYTNLGLYHSAIELLRQSMEESASTDDELDAAQTLTDLGTAYHHLGRYDEALELHEQALAIRERIAPDTEDVAHSLDNIGAAYYFRDDHPQAMRFMSQSLELRKALSPEINEDIATSLNNLGALSSELGEMATAISYKEQAYEAFESLLGPDHQRTLIVLNNLALDLREVGRYEKARPMCEKLISLTESIHAPPHPDLANAYVNCGFLLLREGHLEEALVRFKTAAEQWRETIGEDHHRTMTAEAAIGLTLYRLKRLDEAEHSLAATLAKQTATLGSHSTMASTHSYLAMVMYDNERYREGLDYSRKAFEIANASWPLNEGKRAVYRGYIGRGLSLSHEHVKAVQILEKAHSAALTTYGPNSFAVIRLRDWLEEAEEKAKRDRRQRLSGKDQRHLRVGGPTGFNTDSSIKSEANVGSWPLLSVQRQF